MKISYSFFVIMVTLLAVVVLDNTAVAQQYKLNQATSMAGMKSETTIYVKGMRKRTEGGGYAGMPNNLITIEQCDLQRTITINDKKKLYYLEPFSKQVEEVIDEEEKPSIKNKPVVTQTKATTKKGGVVTMWYNITDTGERKKMYGFTARRIWTTQKIKPSADACMMKDSMIVKTDGWYIDLPQFNCPVRYASTSSMAPALSQLDCKDSFVARRSGKGKLGFPLIEKRTMIMGGVTETNQFETSLETLEFSTAKLDSMLFEIPVGYALAKDMEQLNDKMDASTIMEMFGNKKTETTNNQINTTQPKTAGVVRIGVLVPTGSNQLKNSELQAHLIAALPTDRIQGVAVTSLEEARKYNCELLLTSNISNLKAANKIGGFLKAIKNADPSATSSFNIEAQLSLSKVSDGSSAAQKKVSGKFEGSIDDAAKKALGEGMHNLVKELH